MVSEVIRSNYHNHDLRQEENIKESLVKVVKTANILKQEYEIKASTI